MIASPQARPPRARLLLVMVMVVVTVAVALATATTARADEVPYYGYNYLGPEIPNECWAGCAWSGLNYWDWDGMYKNSGDCTQLGFVGPIFVYFSSSFCSSYNGSKFHVTRTGLGAPAYNRGLCQWASGNTSYVKCFTDIH